ncbi:hypothetical protein CK936_11780 [Streptomyces albireticuli]|uniref:Uncharacterized protein n=1 Tax=Streptomyces albireticuli TaxID=1940 RepID=A0A2A2D8B6_9ACTN|nr:hypothetical protein CK936_11780 [Streptomyces albireticuli]
MLPVNPVDEFSGLSVRQSVQFSFLATHHAPLYEQHLFGRFPGRSDAGDSGALSVGIVACGARPCIRALAAYRVRQSRSESPGVPHDEAFRRVFGRDEA